ncbi:MAG: AAA family ATPase [Proteobacteria bacterium]|nr:AAA family ATPase [Pseudomonadota bacterium]
MSFFKKGSKGRVKKPLFMALYSGPGLGKTDFGASFPSPYFFDFEESTHSIDVERHRPLSFEEIMDDLAEIRDCEDKLSFKSIIFDTIDELERLIHKQVAFDKEKASIDDIGWQKGFGLAVNKWADLISICREIRDKHNIHFCFLAHAFESSRSEIENGLTYSRYSMALHKKAASYIFGQVEMVLFAKKDIALKKTADDRVVAKDIDKRVLYTNLSAIYDAKNRIGLPAELPMPQKKGFDLLWRAYMKAFNDTPETLYKQCLDEIKGVTDETLKKQMGEYVETNKKDLSILRSTLQRIISTKKGAKSES